MNRLTLKCSARLTFMITGQNFGRNMESKAIGMKIAKQQLKHRFLLRLFKF